MNEPILQTSVQAAEPRLWDQAPAWRTLTIAASIMTLAAVATPLLLPPAEAPPPVALVAHPPVHSTPMHLAALPSAPAPAAPRPAPIRHARVQPQPTPACKLVMEKSPRHLGTAIVVGFIDHQQSLQIFQNNGARFGGPVTPTYVNYVRLLIHPDRAPDGITRGTLASPGAHVALGDRVAFDGSYKDPATACSWVPTLVTADLGPAKTNTQP